ncbi:MAG: ABC transporter substrate-binding protein [Bacilli bacterium]|jgi:peptide/nickel transport system substrate-binding protein
MKKCVSLFIFLLVVTSLTFAGGAKETKAVPATGGYQEELRVGINMEPITICTPTKGTNVMCHMMSFSTHSTLVTISDEDNAEIKPCLAESWEILNGGKTIVFHLRKDVKFHNEEAMTSEDVVYSFTDRILKGGTSRALLSSVVSVKADDEYTVRFELSGADQDIFYTLAAAPSCIINKKAVEAEGDEGERYGTGAFKIADYVQGEHVKMVRFEDYFGEKPKTKEIAWVIYLEDSARELALETGEIDICYAPANSDLPYIEQNANLKLISVKGLNVYYVGFNTRTAPYNDEYVRQAIASCIHKEDAITVAFDGLADAVDNVMAPAVPLYSHVDGYSYDPVAAKALLAKSAYPNGFKAKIWVKLTEEEQMALVFKENLTQIGIDLTVERLEATTLKASWNNADYQMCLQKFGNTAGPGTSFSYVFTSTAPANRSKVNDPYVDSQTAAAAVEIDPVKRLGMYKDLNQYITKKAYWAPVCVPQIFIGVKASVQGAVYKGNGSHNLTYAYIEN